MGFMRAGSKGEVPAGTIREFQVGETSVAVANVGGKFCAINSVCAHECGPLGEGDLDGQIVTCPWHGWQFDVTTGKVVASPTLGVDTYPVELRGDDIFVDAGS